MTAFDHDLENSSTTPNAPKQLVTDLESAVDAGRAEVRQLHSGDLARLELVPAERVLVDDPPEQLVCVFAVVAGGRVTQHTTLLSVEPGERGKVGADERRVSPHQPAWERPRAVDSFVQEAMNRAPIRLA